MANTYSQINIHCIFAVKGRQNILTIDLHTELFKYISSILKNDNAYPLAINGKKDMALFPTQSHKGQMLSTIF